MFQNPRRGRQARNFNKCSENSRSQIVFRTDIFRKLSLGAPDYYMTLRSECRGRILREEKVNSLLSSLLLHLKIHRSKGLERVTQWIAGWRPNFSIFKGKTLFGKNKTKQCLNVDCRLIYFIQFNTFLF